MIDRDANIHVGVSTFTRFPCCSAVPSTRLAPLFADPLAVGAADS
jgi:hypothetical protein